MANLHITEFSDVANIVTPVQVPNVPPVADQTPLAISGTSAASAAFNAATRLIYLTPRADCHVAFGLTPVATVNNMPLLSGYTYAFGITPGHKVAVILAA